MIPHGDRPEPETDHRAALMNRLGILSLPFSPTHPPELVHVRSIETGQAATADPVRSCACWRVGSLFQHCVSLRAVGIRVRSLVVSPPRSYSVVYPLDVCVFRDAASCHKTGLSSSACPAPRLVFKPRRGRKAQRLRWGLSAWFSPS
jgi:hypothetical protein